MHVSVLVFCTVALIVRYVFGRANRLLCLRASPTFIYGVVVLKCRIRLNETSSDLSIHLSWGIACFCCLKRGVNCLKEAAVSAVSFKKQVVDVVDVETVEFPVGTHYSATS